MLNKNEITLGELRLRGAIINYNSIKTTAVHDGIKYIQLPSENGNGWFAGDTRDTDNLIMVIKK